MSVIALPNRRLFFPRRIDATLVGNVHRSRSPLAGTATPVAFPGDPYRWRLEYGNNTRVERFEQAAFFDRFRGGANYLRMWFVAQPEPRGTLRGSPTVLEDVSEGASQIGIVGQSGETLLPGDWLQVPLANGKTQLIRVAEASGTGTITVATTAPFRADVDDGAAVVWQRPTADWHVLSPVTLPNEPDICGGFTVELEEWIG